MQINLFFLRESSQFGFEQRKRPPIDVSKFWPEKKKSCQQIETRLQGTFRLNEQISQKNILIHFNAVLQFNSRCIKNDQSILMHHFAETHLFYAEKTSLFDVPFFSPSQNDLLEAVSFTLVNQICYLPVLKESRHCAPHSAWRARAIHQYLDAIQYSYVTNTWS